ncbi:hypothetical protein CCAL9344_05860 [Campylobacter sp. RM9344]|uniref:Mobilization protein n=1 Tax=Campylobacter californiensis TaxID=1032243 RepID=A0AAW3ZYU8_9BACT|nr:MULTISPECIES: hypothetical protein [unclassified Campylobacter]MBE2985429.1 hypothetical protein [Campylobacter sp. RM6883]MBE2986845.1 hypothetical protein [Campylobacter sp. RM12919]MBE2988596.1 hypothetical protein [Campylobacter sp. RM12920]MBE3029705.1 hypothetical protein [Campylobacter sp. RM9344]MBE3608635.1 hypothetical protein [Campylobacter sp. RM9337]
MQKNIKPKKKRQKVKIITKRLRISQSEWDIIAAKMAKVGLKFSQFALACMLSRPMTKNPITKELVLELSYQSNNLNQMVKRLNSGESLDKVCLSIISKTNETLERIYDVLSLKSGQKC